MTERFDCGGDVRATRIENRQIGVVLGPRGVAVEMRCSASWEGRASGARFWVLSVLSVREPDWRRRRGGRGADAVQLRRLVVGGGKKWERQVNSGAQPGRRGRGPLYVRAS